MAPERNSNLSDSWTSFESRFFSFELCGDALKIALLRTKLTEEDNLELFHQQLTAVLDKMAAKKVVLSLGPLVYMSSAAIGKIISLHRRLQRADGMLTICDLTPEIRDVLETSRLLTYLNCEPTES